MAFKPQNQTQDVWAACVYCNYIALLEIYDWKI